MRRQLTRDQQRQCPVPGALERATRTGALLSDSYQRRVLSDHAWFG